MKYIVYGNHGEQIASRQESLLLLAFGVSGHRTYGAGIPILPDEHNVLGIPEMSFLKKLSLKSLFTTGRHVDLPESRFFTSEKISIEYDQPILAQMDGESILLQKEDFPVILERTEPVIPVLKREF
jgi:diacylglycerol kinase family enzyme